MVKNQLKAQVEVPQHAVMEINHYVVIKKRQHVLMDLNQLNHQAQEVLLEVLLEVNQLEVLLEVRVDQLEVPQVPQVEVPKCQEQVVLELNL